MVLMVSRDNDSQTHDRDWEGLRKKLATFFIVSKRTLGVGVAPDFDIFKIMVFRRRNHIHLTALIG